MVHLVKRGERQCWEQDGETTDFTPDCTCKECALIWARKLEHELAASEGRNEMLKLALLNISIAANEAIE